MIAIITCTFCSCPPAHCLSFIQKGLQTQSLKSYNYKTQSLYSTDILSITWLKKKQAFLTKDCKPSGKSLKMKERPLLIKPCMQETTLQIQFYHNSSDALQIIIFIILLLLLLLYYYFHFLVTSTITVDETRKWKYFTS